MPAFNERERLLRTLSELAALESRETITVFLVDDGSSPPVDQASVALSAGQMRVVIARHVVNLGQGAAIETARRIALDSRFATKRAFDAFVTMDADGQHRASDVVALAEAVRKGADIALGNRFAGQSNVPASRRVLLRAALAFERVVTGARLADAHNGLRAFSRRALEGICIRQNRMAHATEITQRITRARGENDALVVVEVPVSVRYTDESLAKGQRAGGALAIVVDLFQGFLFGK